MSRNSKVSAMAMMKLNAMHHQTQANYDALTKEHKKAMQELTHHKKRADQHEKKYQTLEKQHSSVAEELHKLKMAFDGDYAFKYKEEQKKARSAARAAKKTAQQTQRTLRSQKKPT